MYDENNIFAKILRGEIPCNKVYEDDETFVFMDIMPRSNGHCLVIPKTPARNIFDCDEDTLAAVMRTAKKMAIACKKAFDADGITVQQFNESAGGQMVFHFHVHVIPRFEGVKLRPHSGDIEAANMLMENTKKLIAALS